MANVTQEIENATLKIVAHLISMDPKPRSISRVRWSHRWLGKASSYCEGRSPLDVPERRRSRYLQSVQNTINPRDLNSRDKAPRQTGHFGTQQVRQAYL